jgi:hypothetical protein
VATSRDQAPPGRRLLLFLYSTPNLVGCLLGLGGLALYALGIIGPFAPLIVVGLYLIGVLVAPRPRSRAFTAAAGDADLRRELDDLVRTARQRLPADLAARVERIAAEIADLLQLDPDGEAADVLPIVRQVGRDYLPTALDHYLELPPAYASVHPVRDGRTARALLDEQLALIEDRLQAIAEDATRRDARALEEHGHFLEERFTQIDEDLGLWKRSRS